MALPPGKPMSKFDLAGPLTNDDGIPVIQGRVGTDSQPKARLTTVGALRLAIGQYLQELNDAALVGSQEFAEQRAVAALNSANSYTDSQFNQSSVLVDAKSYTDTKTEDIQTQSKNYTDSREALTRAYVDQGDENTLNAALAAIPSTNTFAPLASPGFTGTPTAPNPDAAANNQQIATASFVRLVVASTIDAAPGTLDTLNELAAALGDDPNFAATITAQLGFKAPLASPALTGTPTAPTPDAGDATTKLATTAYVDGRRATALPVVDGTATVGVSARFALEDHAHPTDTSRASLVSPVFTGTPMAPTPADTDNTTKLATTAFVKTAIAGVSGGSGGATSLDGLSDVLIEPNPVSGQVIRYSTTRGYFYNTRLAAADVDGVAPAASPAFTGTPTAPTAPTETNSTQIATTAFVKTAVAAVPAAASASVANVMQAPFSAIMDGVSHPLSQRYATLAAAQAVYPHATALTQEIDWAAIQAAINAVEARGDRGGKVLVPNVGEARINETLTVNPRRLTLEGEGTLLSFVGLAAGKRGFLVRANVGSLYGHRKHKISGFDIKGPGNTITNMTTSGFLFDTAVVGNSSRWLLTDLNIHDWPRAMDYANRSYLIHGHNVDIYDNNEGLYFGPGLADAGENNSFVQSTFYNNTVAVHNAYGMGLQFFACSFDYNTIAFKDDWGETHLTSCHIEHSPQSTWHIEKSGNFMSLTNCWYLVNNGVNTAAPIRTRADGTVYWTGGRGRNWGPTAHQGAGKFYVSSHTELAVGAASTGFIGAA